MKISTNKLIKRVIISTVMAMPALSAHATIIDYNTYFSDTATGLNWLDVTATANRSFSDVSTRIFYSVPKRSKG